MQPDRISKIGKETYEDPGADGKSSVTSEPRSGKDKRKSSWPVSMKAVNSTVQILQIPVPRETAYSIGR